MYASLPDENRRRAWQLERLNSVWSVVSRKVPAHAALVKSGAAPARFDSLEQFASVVPQTTKRDVQTRPAEFTDPTRPADVVYTTGGSTGQPTSIPGWNSERLWLGPDRWMARSWYGITPADELFMIWGHSHLLGTGVRARMKGLLRRTKDRLLGYRRFSAYNLDEARLREAGDIILATRPRYILGYSGALDCFARANADRAEAFRSLGLKAVIASGEIFPAADSVSVIHRTLGAPVAMEYGSVETGVMAHTAPGDSPDRMGMFRVMWRSFLIEAGDPGPDGGHPLLVTALYPMKFPLVRFRIGDEAAPVPGDGRIGLTRLQRIIGRTLDAITLVGGGAVHFDVFEQAATSAPGVERFQLVVRGDAITLNIIAPGVDQKKARQQIEATLAKLDPRVAHTAINFTDRMVQTVAGKTPALVRQPAA